MRILILTLSIVIMGMSLGCAPNTTISVVVDTPPVELSFEIASILDRTEIARSDFINHISAGLSSYMIDDHAKNYFNETLTRNIGDESILIFEDKQSIKGLVKNLLDRMDPLIASNAQKIYTHAKEAPGHRFVCCQHYAHGENNMLTATEDNGNFTWMITIEKRWRTSSGENASVGRASITSNINYSFIPPKTLTIALKVKEVTIKNPTASFLIPSNVIGLAETTFQQDIFEDLFKSLDVSDLNVSNLNANGLKERRIRQIRDQIADQLRTRFKVSHPVQLESVEKNYPVSFRVALSRLQRALKSFKFSEDKSSFRFEDKTEYSYKYGIISYNIIKEIKLFPETGDKTVIVYDLEYESINDDLGNIKDINKELVTGIANETIKNVGNILSM